MLPSRTEKGGRMLMVIEIFDIVFDMSPTKLSSHRTGIVTCTETHELI